MKQKLFFFTTLLLLQGYSLFSQCLSIELSVTWEMGYDIFKKDSIVSIPKLNITYRNNCDTNYYLLKISDNSDKLPLVTCAAMLHYDAPFTYREAAEKYRNYAKEKFNVRISGAFGWPSGWFILSDTIDIHKPHSLAMVSCSLSNIYKYMFYENSNGRYGAPEGRFDLYLDLSHISTDSILGFAKDRFVFLKSGEAFVDTYNLIGFKLVEGCFTFLIDQEEIYNYVSKSRYDIEQKKFVQQEFELPKIAGEYYRYSGAFNTNKVTVCFGEQ